MNDVNEDPYASPGSNVEGGVVAPQYVGFWARVAASMLDSILIFAIIIPIAVLIYGMEYFTSEKLLQGPADFVLNYIFPAILVITFWVYRSATPGKIAVSAKIVDATTGLPPRKSRLIIRYLGYILASIPLFLGIFWVAWDPRKQGWHDKMANTVVVRGRVS